MTDFSDDDPDLYPDGDEREAFQQERETFEHLTDLFDKRLKSFRHMLEEGAFPWSNQALGNETRIELENQKFLEAFRKWMAQDDDQPWEAFVEEYGLMEDDDE